MASSMNSGVPSGATLNGPEPIGPDNIVSHQFGDLREEQSTIVL